MQRVGGRAPPRSSFSHLNPGSEAGSDSTKGPLSGPPGPVASQCPEPTPAVLSGPSRQGGVYWQLGAWPFPPHLGRQPAQGPSGDCPPPGFSFPTNPSQGSPQPPEPGSKRETGADRARVEGACVCVRVHASTRVPAHGNAQGVCVCMCTPRRVCPGLGCADTCPGTSPLHPSTPRPAAIRPGSRLLLHGLPTAPLPSQPGPQGPCVALPVVRKPRGSLTPGWGR